MSRLTVENVSLSFGGLQVLSAVSMEAGPGEIVGIIGPNGAGKTTLLNAICGIHTPDLGRIALDGTACSAEGGSGVLLLRAWAAFRVPPYA